LRSTRERLEPQQVRFLRPPAGYELGERVRNGTIGEQLGGGKRRIWRNIHKRECRKT
jgi:hypothetical protein